MKRCSSFLSISLCIALLIACSKPADDLEINDPVIVSVNDIEIKQSELDYELARTLKNVPDIFIDEQVHSKVLDSIILSRLMAELQLKNATPDEIQDIEQSVNAFRQQKWVEQYIRQNVQATPVSPQQVQAYYQTHLSDFGQKQVKFWRQIQVKKAVDHPKSQQIASALNKLTPESEFNTLKIEGVNITITEGTSEQSGLEAQFTTVLNNLKVNNLSLLQINNKDMYRLLITKEYITDPQPLAVVAKQIQKRLSQQQWKKAIKAEGEKLRAQAQIDYKEL